MSEPIADVTAAREPSPDDPRDPIVIVPRRPGPIVRPAPHDRPDDELDAMIDEMFGPTTDERPGRLDVVLLLAGLALATWGWLTGASLGIFVIAALLILLGVALPARAALRAYHRRRLVAQRRRAIADGYPLDVSDASVAGLVDAYDHVLSVARESASDLAEPSVVASHLAVVEAAALLGGDPPVGEADRRYVDDRTAAITKVAYGLSLAPRRPADTGREAAAAARRARVAVREDLDSATDLGALGRLGSLDARLDARHGPSLEAHADRSPEATTDPER